MKFVEELFGSRFKKSDIANIWKNLSAGKGTISLAEFQERIGEDWKKLGHPIDAEYPRDDWQYEDYTIIKGTQIRNDEHIYNET